MWLDKKDIKKISEILEQFPDVETFELDQLGESGIGTCTTMTFAQTVNGHAGRFTIEIAGVEDW